MIPPPLILNPADSVFADCVAAVPNGPGIYLLTPETGIPYLGWTGYLSKRLRRLLIGTTNQSNQYANLRSKFRKVEYWLTGSRLETSLLLYRLARLHDPEHYRKRLKLKSPWFLSLLANDEFPRLAVQGRVPGDAALAFGPFPSRDSAERYQAGIEGLFQIRRCSERLRPSEEHPGCIYGEMNACLRPCQLAVSTEEYAAEAARVSGYLQSHGRHSLAVLAAMRDEASQQTDFEQAARVHRDLERVQFVNGLRDELVCEVESLSGVAVTRAVGDRSVALWPIVSGYWQPPLKLNFAEPESNAKSLDAQLRSRLEAHLAHPAREGDRTEHAALLARWYYSTWRDGDWAPFRKGEINYRKLVRSISGLLRTLPAPAVNPEVRQ